MVLTLARYVHISRHPLLQRWQLKQEIIRMNAPQSALHRATTSASMANYGAIFAGFQAMGIPADQIQPRQNIFTFAAWRAL